MNWFQKKSKKTTSGLTSQEDTFSEENGFFNWMKTWWPIVLLILAFVTAGITKYIFPNDDIYDLCLKVIKAIGILMVVLYVIYTRLLAIETKKMAKASIGLYNSDRGTVLVELKQGVCSFDSLCEDVKKITKSIHLNEKNVPETEFEMLMKDQKVPGVSVSLKNRSGRSIDLSKVEYTIRHTGASEYHQGTFDISKSSTLKPWEDSEVYLIASPEGEIEIIVHSIQYIDGGIVRKVSVEDSIVVERIRKPIN